MRLPAKNRVLEGVYLMLFCAILGLGIALLIYNIGLPIFNTILLIEAVILFVLGTIGLIIWWKTTARRLILSM